MPALRVYGIPQVNAQLLSHVDKLERKKKKGISFQVESICIQRQLTYEYFNIDKDGTEPSKILSRYS